MKEKFLNKKCIIRGDRSGVFFGTVVEINGQEVLMENVRRVHYWMGAASISQIACDGIKNHENSRITVAVSSVFLTDVIEINICEEKAIENIERAPEWKL